VSSLGKGIAAASIGRLLVSRGLTVGLQKFDPYITSTPARCRPTSTARCSSTEDGAETGPGPRPLRALQTDANTSRASNVNRRRDLRHRHPPQRRGDYLGGTVQVVPQHHLTRIKQRISR